MIKILFILFYLIMNFKHHICFCDLIKGVEIIIPYKLKKVYCLSLNTYKYEFKDIYGRLFYANASLVNYIFRNKQLFKFNKNEIILNKPLVIKILSINNKIAKIKII